jgi:hypothetical protein
MNHKFAVTKKRKLSMFLEGKNPVSILNELYPGINFTVVSSQVRLRNFFFLSNFSFFLLRLAISCYKYKNYVPDHRVATFWLELLSLISGTKFRLRLKRKCLFSFLRKN